jgi:hypothetical protein
MDCCGSNEPKEIKKEQTGIEQNSIEKEHKHGGGSTTFTPPVNYISTLR